jgi:hypothetical protein
MGQLPMQCKMGRLLEVFHNGVSGINLYDDFFPTSRAVDLQHSL